MPTPRRNGRSFQKVTTDREAWSTTSPKLEALHCLKIAKANGGIEHMRATIGIAPEELAELTEWMEREPAIAGRISACIVFRERVLAEFDRLAALAPSASLPCQIA